MRQDLAVSRPSSMRSAWRRPWPDAGQPAGNVGGVAVVFTAECRPQRRLLIADDEEVEAEPQDRSIEKQTFSGEQKSLPKDERDHRNVDGVADVTVGAGHHQMAGRQHGSWRADSLQRKSRERIKQRKESHSDESRPDKFDPGRVQYRWLYAPLREPPGNHAREESRSDDEEDDRADASGHAV